MEVKQDPTLKIFEPLFLVKKISLVKLGRLKSAFEKFLLQGIKKSPGCVFVSFSLKYTIKIINPHHMNQRDGIVNGSMGTVIDFVKVLSKNDKGEEVVDVKSIIVVFDDPETGLERIKNYRHDEQIRVYAKQNGVPIFRANQIYEAPYRKNYKTHR